MNDPNLLIPKNVSIQANQAGFVGETAIDITPLTPQTALPSNTQANNPRNVRCNSALFICNNARVNGEVGVSFIALLQSGTKLAESYSDPAFFNNVNALVKNASITALQLSRLSSELALLSRTAQRDLGTVTTAVNSVARSTNQTVNQVGLAANRFGNTAEQYSLTAAQLNQLIASANNLVTTNRGGLVRTLNSIGQTSDQLRTLLTSLTPAVAQVNSAAGRLNATAGQVRLGRIVQNLETLSTNAAAASANLRDISASLNSPDNVLVLQRTLDSARVTFENTQKITSDLDELTGDPAFRDNLKKLVNGLGNLVSSTQQLQQQIQVAQTIEPVSAALNASASSASTKPPANEQSQRNVEPKTFLSQQNTYNRQLLELLPLASEKPINEETSQPTVNSGR